MNEKELSGPYLVLDDNQSAIYFFHAFQSLTLQTLLFNILTLVLLTLSTRERRFFLVIPRENDLSWLYTLLNVENN